MNDDNPNQDTEVQSNIEPAQYEQQLQRDAALAAKMMMESEGARLANLSRTDRAMIESGLAEKLKQVSHDQGLDVEDLRRKLEMSRSQAQESGYEL